MPPALLLVVNGHLHKYQQVCPADKLDATGGVCVYSMVYCRALEKVLRCGTSK